MIIPITISPSAFSSSFSSDPTLPPNLAKISHSEYALIELQGTLEVESNYPAERDGQFIGTFTIDADGKKPTLLIGHHLLEGKVVSLPKPLGVLLRTRPKPPPVQQSDTMISFPDDHDGSTSTSFLRRTDTLPVSEWGGGLVEESTMMSVDDNTQTQTQTETQETQIETQDEESQATSISSFGYRNSTLSRSRTQTQTLSTFGSQSQSQLFESQPGDESFISTTSSSSSTGPSGTPQPIPKWTIVAIVKKKIVFSKRPMPILNVTPGSSMTAIPAGSTTTRSSGRPPHSAVGSNLASTSSKSSSFFKLGVGK
ncbi:hypothetical protein BDN72DRAFT_100575 [Pluteus cervinus]|uniref:Uncharacterized protein n=1 Tax=Pluteus cervinus TaxID=181527 RepID=A0ACD3B720_9AGAR|nr:hypothetical protein BDN72DRAFT_100575 [Pluteus cervinus]